MMNQGVERKEVARIMRLPYGKAGRFSGDGAAHRRAAVFPNYARIAEADIAIKTSKGGGGNGRFAPANRNARVRIGSFINGRYPEFNNEFSVKSSLSLLALFYFLATKFLK
jgi:hypothetical protein